jgi:hypothetical protein
MVGSLKSVLKSILNALIIAKRSKKTVPDIIRFGDLVKQENIFLHLQLYSPDDLNLKIRLLGEVDYY